MGKWCMLSDRLTVLGKQTTSSYIKLWYLGHNLVWISPGGEHRAWVCAGAVASRKEKVIVTV